MPAVFDEILGSASYDILYRRLPLSKRHTMLTIKIWLQPYIRPMMQYSQPAGPEESGEKDLISFLFSKNLISFRFASPLSDLFRHHHRSGCAGSLFFSWCHQFYAAVADLPLSNNWSWASNAHIVRTIQFASATATTLRGFRKSKSSQGAWFFWF